MQDRLSARDFLQRFKTDVDKMFAMRALLWEQDHSFSLPRMSDDEIIDQTAALLSGSGVHIHTFVFVAPPVSKGGSGISQATGAPFPLSGRKAPPQASQASPSDPPTFSDIDVGAQAAALMAAAASGQPFCPE